MLHIQGNEHHAAESQQQTRKLDQVQERMPAQVAQHESQDHGMKLAKIFHDNLKATIFKDF